jgi:hypothetical protein
MPAQEIPQLMHDITFLSNVGVLLPFQESRVVKRENTHSLEQPHKPLQVVLFQLTRRL